MVFIPTGNELVVIYPLQGQGNYEATPEGFPVLSTQIVPLNELGIGAGGGYSQQSFVVAGTTAAATSINLFIGWSSAATAPKTQTIPASVGSLGIITVSDLAGTAYTYPITLVPASGPPIIGNQNQVYTNFATLTLLDTEAGWVAI